MATSYDKELDELLSGVAFPSDEEARQETGNERRSLALTGRTKETDPGRASQAAKLSKRTKENDPRIAKKAAERKGKNKLNDPGQAAGAKSRTGRTKETCPGRLSQSIKTTGVKKPWLSEKMAGEGNPMYGVCRKGDNAGEKNGMFGKPAANRGKTPPKFKCVHCDKEVSLGNLNRWHNDNCKFKN